MMRPEMRDRRERERLLAQALGPVANDLRLLDLEHFRSKGGDRFGDNVNSLVRSSIELAFAAQTLQFPGAGEIELSWTRRPRLVMPLEFHHRGVHAYFRLILEAHTAAVDLDYMAVEGAEHSTVAETAALEHALSAAQHRATVDEVGVLRPSPG